MWMIRDFPLLVFVLSLVVLWLSAQIGVFWRNRSRPLEEVERTDLATVLTATLTLLGLIIAFSFSMAVSRYDQRKNYEAEEANAIGTEHVRAALLPAANTERVRELLRQYLRQRVLFYESHDERQLEEIDKDTAALEVELWSTVQARSCGAAQPGHGPRSPRNERRFEYQGIHAGCVVEPYSPGGVVSDGRHRNFLQPVDRLWRASEGDHPFPGLAAGAVYLVLSHIRHRQPARRRDTRASAKSGKPRSVAERTIVGLNESQKEQVSWNLPFPRYFTLCCCFLAC